MKVHVENSLESNLFAVYFEQAGEFTYIVPMENVNCLLFDSLMENFVAHK